MPTAQPDTAAPPVLAPRRAVASPASRAHLRPLGSGPALVVEEGGPESAPAALRDRRILIADDEDANLRLLQALLRRAGYREVVATRDPREVVELCETYRPDLLLLDLRMPGLDGFGVLEALRERHGEEAGPGVPVLVLSGDERAETKRRALAGGARDFLAKPFDTLEALLRIRSLLEIRALHDELCRHNERLERSVRLRTRRLRKDIAARKRSEAALRQSEERHRKLVESAGDLIYWMDDQLRITRANPAALRLTGYDPERDHGLSLPELVPEEHRAAVRRFYAEQLARRTPSTTRELPVRTRGGGELWLGQSVHLLEEDGQVTGLCVIARDMTARREVERVKDELVSVISHELRTPLTAINASVSMMAGGVLDGYPERSKRMLEVAAQNTQRLMRLVNDILEVESLGSGKVRLERRPCRVAELVLQATDAVRPLAERADVWLVPTLLEQEFSLDPDRTCQVLINLLSNAVKFSPRGGTVWLRAERCPDGLHLSVRDQGRGIPSDKLEAIFERFQQVDSSDAREKGGTGLGLPICRGIVEMHGGRIWAESTPGAGSTFHVIIPEPRPEEEPAAE